MSECGDFVPSAMTRAAEIETEGRSLMASQTDSYCLSEAMTFRLRAPPKIPVGEPRQIQIAVRHYDPAMARSLISMLHFDSFEIEMKMLTAIIDRHESGGLLTHYLIFCRRSGWLIYFADDLLRQITTSAAGQ